MITSGLARAPRTATRPFTVIGEANNAGKYLADEMAGFADERLGLSVAVVEQSCDVPGRFCVPPKGLHPSCQSAATGNGFEATAAAAAAQSGAVFLELDMADISGGARCAAIELPVEDDPGSNAGSDFDVDERLRPGPCAALLAQSHEIHILLNEGRDAKGVL